MLSVWKYRICVRSNKCEFKYNGKVADLIINLSFSDESSPKLDNYDLMNVLQRIYSFIEYIYHLCILMRSSSIQCFVISLLFIPFHLISIKQSSEKHALQPQTILIVHTIFFSISTVISIEWKMKKKRLTCSFNLSHSNRLNLYRFFCVCARVFVLFVSKSAIKLNNQKGIYIRVTQTRQ